MGLPLHEYMGWPGPTTHRQHLAWVAWLAEEWNRPSRTDHYIMQATQQVLKTPARVWGKEPRGEGFGLDDLKISFGTQQPAGAIPGEQDRVVRGIAFSQESGSAGVVIKLPPVMTKGNLERYQSALGKGSWGSLLGDDEGGGNR